MADSTGPFEFINKQQFWVIFCIIAGVSILVLLVLIKVFGDGKGVLGLGDIAIALVPLFLFLLATGQIKALGIGPQGVSMELADVFREAASQPASEGVTELPVEDVPTATKGKLDRLPQVVKAQPRALRFKLGWGGYKWPAVRGYLETLSLSPRFQYVVFDHRNGTFFGLVEAQKLMSLIAARARSNLEEPDPNQIEAAEIQEWETFTDKIVDGNGEALANELPGFVTADKAVRKGVDTRKALDLMEKAETDMLPFVDEHDKFAGVVERPRLVASLVLHVTDALKKTDGEAGQNA